MMTVVNSRTQWVRFCIVSAVSWVLMMLGGAGSVSAWELGHYSAGMMNIRDFIQPPPGDYFLLYALNYRSDTVKDKNGNSVTTASVGPININVDMDVNSYTLVPTYALITDKEIWGAHYGFLMSQPIGNPSFQSSLELANFPGINRDIDESSYGFGDTYVRPLWLGWNFGQADIGALYGLYIPVGKYDAGEVDNIGLGMWTHEFMASAAYYIDEQKGTALTLAGTYEIHHEKEDINVTPGSHFTLNYGASQYLPVNEKFLSEVGVAGFGQWQVTKDRGSDALDKDVKDRVYGLGFQAGLTYLPLNGQLTFKWSHEFAAKHRFEGDFYTITGVLPF